MNEVRKASARALRTTMVFHQEHGWHASFWRLAWLGIVLFPFLLGFGFQTLTHTGGMLIALSGAIMLFPAAVVMLVEGWRGAFTCTAIVSFFAYLIYCNAPLIFGDALIAPTDEDYPSFGLSLREPSAYINLVGCSALAGGLLLGYRPPRPVSAVDRLRPGKLFVPDEILRNSIIGIIAAFVLVRIFLIIQLGQVSFGAFLTGGRSNDDVATMAGPFSFIVNLASVFQVTAVVGAGLLLARRSKVPFAKIVAITGIAIPIAVLVLRGGRGHVIGYFLALIAFAVTIPIPSLQARMKKAMPALFAFLILGFAVITVTRSEGFSGAKGSNIAQGLSELVQYDQFTALEQTVYVFPNIAAPIGGETIVAMPANPVPRAIWPNKPRDLGVILPALLKDKPTATLSAGLIGEGWANFLWWGAIFLPFLVGLFASVWDRLRNVGARWSDGYALWASAIPGLFFIVRGSFMTGGVTIMYAVVGMFMLLVVSGRMQDKERSEKTTRA